MMINGADDAEDDLHNTNPRLSQEVAPPSENWDDDFEFQPRATDRTRDGKYDATNAPQRPVHSNEHEESWDDAFADEDPDVSPVKRVPKVDDQDVEDWDSSDNEAPGDHECGRDQNFNSEPLRRFGAGFEEEDKTVTARPSSSHARSPSAALPVPSISTHIQNSQYPPPSSLPFHVPPLPSHHSQPSTSPTLSSFSIPISSNRASIYSQDPLMPTVSNGSAPHLSLSVMRAYPQGAGSTPPRKGRRLRKKSRPPEADIFELEDHEPDPLPVPDSPVPLPDPPSPPRPVTPPTTNATTAPPTPSPSLLTRIGSFKRWARRSLGPDDTGITGFRRGKVSTGPSEAGHVGKSSVGPEELALVQESLDHDLRAVSPTPPPGKARLRRSRGGSASGQKAGWFFRAGGGGGVEREEMSVSTSPPFPAPVPARTPEPSPSKRTNPLAIRRGPKEMDGSGGTPTPKKTRGRLIPALRAGGSIVQTQIPSGQTSPVKPTRDAAQARRGTRPSSQPQSSPSMQFPSHPGSASVGRSAGVPLSVVISSAETPTLEENEAGDAREREGGMRSLINGVRRLSLVGGAHKRTKSTGGEPPPADVAMKSERTDDAGRSRSRTEGRPVSGASSAGPRPVSRASTNMIGPLNGSEKEAQVLLPPVELDSPHIPKRDSIPWTDYEPLTGLSEGYVAVNGDVPMHDTGVVLPAPGHFPPAPFCPPLKEQQPARQSFSSSATSLFAGLPTRSGPALTSSERPTTPERPGTPPRSYKMPAASSQGTAGSVPHALPPLSSPRTGSTTTIPATQSASLGRSTASPAHAGSVLRRNSLGDFKTQTPPRGELKIPARISRAQQGLRRDMGMVREFAACVEKLKHLQGTYTSLIGDLRSAYDASPIAPASRPISPAQVQYHLPSRPSSQISNHRKITMVNANPSLQSVHATASHSSTVLPQSAVSSTRSDGVDRELVRLDHEYGLWWECAELLVELGGGSMAGTVSNPNLVAHSGSGLNTPATESFKGLAAIDRPLRGTSPGLHVASMSEPGSIFEHALAEAPASKGPPQATPPQWRASTGRHDLSARQLRLLRDMLNTPDPASLAYAAGPYGYGAGYPPSLPYSYGIQEGEDAQPWVPWNPSTATLPSEESSTDPHVSGVPNGHLPIGRTDSKEKKRRASRLGMLGLREILRGLKRNAIAANRLDWTHQHGQPGSGTSASPSNSAEDDHYNRRRSPWHEHDEHHSKHSTGPQEDSPLEVPAIRNVPPKSPRRPSLASIFRLGQKSTRNGSNKGKVQSSNGNSTTEDEPEAGLGGGAMGEYSDWERMSRSDLDLAAGVYGAGTETVRGKKRPPSRTSSNPNLLVSQSHPSTNLSTPKRTPTPSQTSLRETSPPSGTPPQPSNLPISIAEEGSPMISQRAKSPRPGRLKKERAPSWSQTNAPLRPSSRNGKGAMTGTVRSAPPSDLSSVPDPKLALTPANIKPLLEYAKEVSVRLGECIVEVQTLLSVASPAKAM